MTQPLRIDVVSDVVCPWCYVGKRRLEKALAQRPNLKADIQWRPFQLNPEMPRAGANRLAYYREKFGADRADRIIANMQQTGAEEGIDFGSDPEAMAPNTLSAHALLLWASEDASIDAGAIAEKLFHAHHVDCENLGDHSVLARIAGEAGMVASDVADKLARGEDEARVQTSIREAVEMGVTGVPFFIINGKYGLSGAQPPDVLIQAFESVDNIQT